MIREVGPRVPYPATPGRDEAVQQAVDDYLLMERKARAWDWLRANLPSADAYKTADLLAGMDALVHSAQAPSKG